MYSAVLRKQLGVCWLHLVVNEVQTFRLALKKGGQQLKVKTFFLSDRAYLVTVQHLKPFSLCTAKLASW